jgi:hypothetical protein
MLSATCLVTQLSALVCVVALVLQARSELLNGLSAAYTAQASEGEGKQQLLPQMRWSSDAVIVDEPQPLALKVLQARASMCGVQSYGHYCVCPRFVAAAI